MNTVSTANNNLVSQLSTTEADVATTQEILSNSTTLHTELVEEVTDLRDLINSEVSDTMTQIDSLSVSTAQKQLDLEALLNNLEAKVYN